MSAPERELHRKVAASCFNRAWDLLDAKARTEEDDLEMLNLSHTSLYHWRLVGTPRNRAIGEWQLSRVYSELEEPGLSLRLAKSCLATCRTNHLYGIVHTAYEGMARAYACAGDIGRARRYLEMAKTRLDKAGVDEEDRAAHLKQIQETERYMRVARARRVAGAARL